MAVEVIAESLGLAAIRLDCVDDEASMAWYRQRGFVEEGDPTGDAEWGILRPMVKAVGRSGVP